MFVLFLLFNFINFERLGRLNVKIPVSLAGPSWAGGDFDVAKISFQRLNRLPSRVTRRYVA
jgi:hypothetical protein